MITTRVFIAGPIDGTDEQVDATSLTNFYCIPQCVLTDDSVKYFSVGYRLDRDLATGIPNRDNHGRVIYRYSEKILTSERKRGYWTDIVESEGEVAQ